MSLKIQELLRNAAQLLQKNDIKTARHYLSTVLEIDKSNLPALQMLGLISAKESDFKEAVKFLKRAAKICPDDAGIHYNLAKAMADAGLDRDALEHHRKTIKLNPKNHEAWLNFGKSAYKLNLFQDALIYFDNAINLNADYYDAIHNKGITLHALKRYEDSLHCFNQALNLKPNAYECWLKIGLVLIELKQFDKAFDCFKKALLYKPTDLITLNHIVRLLYDLKQYPEALEYCNLTIKINPDFYEGINNKGLILHALKRYEEALESYDRALSLNNKYCEAYSNKGLTLHTLKRYEEALESYNRALSLKADYYEAYLNKALTLFSLNQLDSALRCCNLALKINPDNYLGWTNKGLVFASLNQFQDALLCQSKAISINTDIPESWLNRGYTLFQQKKFLEALSDYKKALSIRPDYPDALYNSGLIYLLDGNLEDGFRHYESRLQSDYLLDIMGARPLSSAPRLQPNHSLKNKTVLLYGEQGFGDYIQFCRFVKIISDQGANVVLEIPKPLNKLLANLPGVSHAVIKGEEIPFHDFHCSLLSLPFVLKTNITSIPYQLNYIHYKDCPLRRRKWEERFCKNRKPLIGLAWSGNPHHKNDRNRSISLENIIPFLSDKFEYISLQKEINERDKKVLAENPSIRNFSKDLEDYSDTASLINLLDLVISVDTSIAHLSGALGKKTWLLLPFLPDWRWMLDRSDSPWYPSISIYRQTAVGDWNGLLSKLSLDLHKHAKFD